MSNKNQIIATPNAALYVAHSPIHGRGVYTSKLIKQGDVIETCPVIKMMLEEMSVRRQMVLSYYAFMLDEPNGHCGFPLGYGSLYNHADDNNATYYYEEEKELMIFEANRKIAKHEEITINYLGAGATDKGIDLWANKPEI